MKRGPKEKPAVIKLMAGNPGKRPIKEGVQPSGNASQPEGLREYGKQIWSDMEAVLGPLGLFTKADERMAFLYCQAWDEYYETAATIAERGLYSVNQQGAECVAPWVKIRDAAIERIRKLSAEFGMSPSARDGLNVSQPKANSLESYKLG